MARKFDPAGDPITAFGKNGKLAGQSAKGSGDLQSGSTTIESVTTTGGAFSVGQGITGAGIPSGATITALGAGSLEISQPATASGLTSLTGGLNFEEYGYAGMPGGIAVDNDPSSPSYRDLYVPDLIHDVIDKFGPSGEFISQIKSSPMHFPLVRRLIRPTGTSTSPSIPTERSRSLGPRRSDQSAETNWNIAPPGSA